MELKLQNCFLLTFKLESIQDRKIKSSDNDQSIPKEPLKFFDFIIIQSSSGKT